MSELADKYEALLKVSQTIASNRDMPSLMEACAELLHSVVHFEYFALPLYGEIRNSRITSTSIHPANDERIAFEDGPAAWVFANQKPCIHSIEELRLRYPKIAAFREPDNVKSICTVPLTTAHRRLGAMEFLSTRPNAYDEEDAYFIQQVASQVAIAVDNALNYETIRLERDRTSTLLKVANAVGSKRDIEEVFKGISQEIADTIRAEYICFLIHDPEINGFRAYLPTGPGLNGWDWRQFHGPVTWAKAFSEKRRQLARRTENEKFALSYPQVAAMLAQNMETFCCVPLIAHSKCVGVLVVGQKEKDGFNAENVEILDGISSQLAIGIRNALDYQEISQLKDKLASENLYLEEEIRTDHNFGEIIGESDALRDLLSQVEMVAASDTTTALILGETGVGKELIARAIHRWSERQDRPLVKLNCAAIPLGLLESELFGHEKGAFTGAVAQKVGRLELAHRGTLFLDEVGEIPLELQPKLLRAIQEREFERLGGTRAIHVDVRIIAATNRDLRQMVADHQFRNDLFYRLNVFPLRVPPLRQRQTDIPLLVRHFVQKHAHRMKRDIDKIPAETMQTLCEYPWPGNVRELENLMERSVLLSRGSVLKVPTSELLVSDIADNVEVFQKLFPRKPKKTEKDLIVEALRETGGVISGPRGAATKLGLKRSTLVSRMKRLGF